MNQSICKSCTVCHGEAIRSLISGLIRIIRIDPWLDGLLRCSPRFFPQHSRSNARLLYSRNTMSDGNIEADNPALAPVPAISTGSGPEPPVPSSWATLAHELFRFLWIASVVSNIGTMMQDVGASWLMTELAPSPLMVALIQTAGALPVLLLSFAAGRACRYCRPPLAADFQPVLDARGSSRSRAC